MSRLAWGENYLMRARAGARRGWPAGKKFPHIMLLYSCYIRWCENMWVIAMGCCECLGSVRVAYALSCRVVLRSWPLHTPTLVRLLSAPLLAPLFLCAPASGRSYCLRSVQINCCAVIICSGLINVFALPLDSFFCCHSALSLKSLVGATVVLRCR